VTDEDERDSGKKKRILRRELVALLICIVGFPLTLGLTPDIMSKSTHAGIWSMALGAMLVLNRRNLVGIRADFPRLGRASADSWALGIGVFGSATAILGFLVLIYGWGRT
jgi:hypothetical protein